MTTSTTPTPLQQLAANTARLQALAQADYWPHRATDAYKARRAEYVRNTNAQIDKAEKETGTK